MKINDGLNIYSNCSLDEFDLFIYDRWGGVIYSGKNLSSDRFPILINSNNWVDGVYSYKIEQRGKYNLSKPKLRHGTILVVR
jgi:hypothetical protein